MSMLSKQNQVFLIIHFTYIYIPVFLLFSQLPQRLVFYSSVYLAASLYLL